ncbi:hypothetical protein AAKU55_004924 [Oxalobacteraceae bacterium GrIS 1.11]
MAIQIEVRGGIDRIIADLGRVKREVLDKAIPRALNRTGAMAITQASRELRADGYNFSAAEVKAAIQQRKATSSSFVTTLKVRRKTKSLIAFSPRESKAGVTVRVHGQAKLIKGAFIAQRLNGASGVFIEDKKAGKIVLRRQKQYKRGSKGGWHSLPARKLYGPSVGGAYANDKVQGVMTAFIGEKFAERLAHEIKHLSR